MSEVVTRAMNDYLGRLWRKLRDSSGPADVEYVRGSVDALYAASVLTPDERDLWMRRIDTCPGHDDEGGRSWCAYCGDSIAEALER